MPQYLSEGSSSQELLTKLLDTLHQHMNTESKTKKYCKDEDILQEIRTFCADETVSPDIKHEVLQLIERSVNLTGEDKILLLHHQTEAIVHKHWEIELSITDMESNENVHRLFSQIFNKTVTHQQLLAVASLLSIWPPFENERDSEGAWYLVLLKLITDANDGLSVVKIASEKDMQLKKKDFERIFDALLKNCDQLLAFKFGFLVGDDEMFEFVVNQMKTLEPDQAKWDNELLELFFKNKLSSRIVETPYFAAYVNHLLKGEMSVDRSRESRVNEVMRELHEAGHTIQAASIKASFDNLHPGLRTLDNVLGTFLKWVRKS